MHGPLSVAVGPCRQLGKGPLEAKSNRNSLTAHLATDASC